MYYKVLNDKCLVASCWGPDKFYRVIDYDDALLEYCSTAEDLNLT
jgi:hypothetical protein